MKPITQKHIPVEGWESLAHATTYTRKGVIRPPLQKDHLYKKTTLQKDHPFQTEMYMKKGSQDEKWVPVVA